MKFALVNGERKEARPNLSGKCPACDQPMVAKCGKVRVWHWAHKGSRSCDPWWENETAWHRAWKGQFPTDWQEVVHKAKNGEKHIADVKTDCGWVIEFQHSYIKPEERQSRDSFYPKLVWVVDGTRREKDKDQFADAWNSGTPVDKKSLLRVTFRDKCVLFKEWSNRRTPIFIDFGGPYLFWLINWGKSERLVYLRLFPRPLFTVAHIESTAEGGCEFDKFAKEVGKFITDYESQLQTQTLRQAPQRPLSGFDKYLIRQQRNRRRF